MIPQSQPKKKKNSSKANLIISAVVHGILVAVLFYFAAKEGLLGKKIKDKMNVEVVKKEKPPEPPKPKAEPPKIEPPKIEPPKTEAPKTETVKAPVAVPVVAPPADVPAMEGFYGKEVDSENDPVQLYKGYMEYTLRTKWDRPDNLDDDQYVAEVAVNVDKQGNVTASQWLKGSGNAKWDQTVKDVFATVSNIGKPPPTNFPPTVTIRFDVETEDEPLMTP
jgi:TonB family protein